MTTFTTHSSIKPADFTKLRTELLQLCQTHNVSPTPALKMSPHLQRANGMCRYKYMRDRLRTRQPVLSSIEILIATRLVHEFGVDRAIETLRHEFAHAYCLHRYGEIGHSERFKEFCTRIGGTMNQHLAGTRYAEAASTEFIKPTMNWRYTCPCGCTHERRSRWSQAALCSRFCRKCGSLLGVWTLTRLT